jgi:hypothetical protein
MFDPWPICRCDGPRKGASPPRGWCSRVGPRKGTSPPRGSFFGVGACWWRAEVWARGDSVGMRGGAAPAEETSDDVELEELLEGLGEVAGARAFKGEFKRFYRQWFLK